RLFALRAQVGLVRLLRAEGRVELDDIERLRRLRSGIAGIPDAHEADALLSGGAGPPSTGEGSEGSTTG
ncbi:hypothetical protein BE08_29605, partial [Sorangium cellulosum]